jgi:hypothetical protein
VLHSPTLDREIGGISHYLDLESGHCLQTSQNHRGFWEIDLQNQEDALSATGGQRAGTCVSLLLLGMTFFGLEDLGKSM